MFDASNPQLMRGYSKSESRKAVKLGFRAAVFLEAEVIQAKHSLTLPSM
jgi:activator of 2-hydroxyglutaryl-CoA dehydratase